MKTVKPEYVGHNQNPLRVSLRRLCKKMKVQTFSDGQRIGGHGRITDKAIQRNPKTNVAELSEGILSLKLKWPEIFQSPVS
jgi:hypothetical protein